MSKRQSPNSEGAGPSRKRSREEEENTGPQPSSVKSRAQQYEKMLSEKKAKEGDTPQSKGARSGAEEEAGPPPVPAAVFLKLREENEKNKRELEAARLALREAANDRTELHRQLVELESLLEAERAVSVFLAYDLAK
ncbi:hypothetical protein HNY73_018821 [Argiope bruennichi]|uniref:Uncharacterized protein n=1 Tax=Argiope bruennichi TaxID=94029 RepID=A0A8T0EHK0_ARGBR|nr:hypothetical protein HNY73_018821 [Argiope bruennichi]